MLLTAIIAVFGYFGASVAPVPRAPRPGVNEPAYSADSVPAVPYSAIRAVLAAIMSYSC